MKSKKQSYVTLQQVADHAGVSRATASLVVRNSPNISEATRAKVLNSIEELGYVYDRVAANLRSRLSSTVGLIITEIGNPFFAEILVGVHQELDKEGYTVILGTTFDSPDKQALLLKTMLEYRVGGVILSSASGSSDDGIKLLRQRGIPVVLVTREPLLNQKYDFVGINNIEGAKLAVNHLIENGHRRIAFIGGKSNSSAWKHRTKGYSEALSHAGIESDDSLLIETSVTRKGGIEGIKKAFNQDNPPTAAFCYNDIVAFGVMTGLKEIGLSPGTDIAVVGFDDIQEASMFVPPLSTIKAFPQSIGTYAADLLDQRMKGLDEDPKRLILEPELVIRDSSNFKIN